MSVILPEVATSHKVASLSGWGGVGRGEGGGGGGGGGGGRLGGGVTNFKMQELW